MMLNSKKILALGKDQFSQLIIGLNNTWSFVCFGWTVTNHEIRSEKEDRHAFLGDYDK